MDCKPSLKITQSRREIARGKIELKRWYDRQKAGLKDNPAALVALHGTYLELLAVLEGAKG